MAGAVDFVVRHGEVVISLYERADQLGIPVPAVPGLLAIGALAAVGKVNVPLALVSAVAASLLADVIWYGLGRRRGSQVLRLLCRISLEPDSCVRRTEDVFLRYGVRSLIVAKFVPGLSTVAPHLAGMIGVGLPRFVAYSALSALLWAGTWGGLGYFAGEALQRVTDQSEHVGRILLASVVAGLVVYLLVKWTQRQRFLRSLRAARISQEALKEHLDSGEPIVIVDLRSELDARAVPLDHPGVAADGPRGARGTPSGDPAGPGRCPVLLLTERGDERPGGAGSATTRGDPGETPGGWLPGVARARVPGGTTAVPRAVTDRSWRLCVEDVDAFGKRACMNERRVDRRSIRDVDPVRRRSTC